jgi:hypothetical protein
VPASVVASRGPVRSPAMADVPLLIEFVGNTRIFREPDFTTGLPIVDNGPPGTFILFDDGRRVSIPTDQVVFSDDTSGAARIGLGGMSFDGEDGGYLVFLRGLGRRMTLEPGMVSMIYVNGGEVWPLHA